MKRKPVLSLMFAFILLFSPLQTAFAAESYVTININHKTVYTQLLTANIDGYTMVPIRLISDAFGYQTDWDAEKRAVIISQGSFTATMAIGEKNMYYGTTLEPETKELPVPAQIIWGLTYVPLRSVADVFDSTITWDADTRTVNIITKDAPAAPVIIENAEVKLGDYTAYGKTVDGIFEGEVKVYDKNGVLAYQGGMDENFLYSGIGIMYISDTISIVGYFYNGFPSEEGRIYHEEFYTEVYFGKDGYVSDGKYKTYNLDDQLICYTIFDKGQIQEIESLEDDDDDDYDNYYDDYYSYDDSYYKDESQGQSSYDSNYAEYEEACRQAYINYMNSLKSARQRYSPIPESILIGIQNEYQSELMRIKKQYGY